MSTLSSPTPLSWPLDGLSSEADETRGRYFYTEGEKSIRQCLWNILLTRPGERLMRPEFGVGIRDFINQPNNETTRYLMADVIQKGIERWENRIVLQSVEVSADALNLAQVNITLNYRLKSSGQADVLSFNLNMDA